MIIKKGVLLGIMVLLLVPLIQANITNENVMDGNWSTRYIVNYIKPNITHIEITHIENWVAKRSYDINNLNKTANVTGTYGSREFECWPTNKTSNFNSRIYDCKWTSEPTSGPVIIYEEMMFWEEIYSECNNWCKINRIYNKIVSWFKEK